MTQAWWSGISVILREAERQRRKVAESRKLLTRRREGAKKGTVRSRPPGCVAFVYTSVYIGTMKITGLDWDGGNWPKCGKHGVSREEIEQALLNEPAVMTDPHPEEPRMRAIGKTKTGRYVFMVFMLREISGEIKLRPISARYMHQKEIAHYEKNQI